MLPLMRYIVPLFKEQDVHIMTIHIEDGYRFDEVGKQHNILSYPDTDSMNRHTVLSKFKKYASLVKGISSMLLQYPDCIMYTVDYQVASMLIWFKRKWRPRLRIIYHQFEAFEIDRNTGVNKKMQHYLLKHADKLDLAVFPEKNRMNLFTERMNGHVLHTMLVPNSNNLSLQHEGADRKRVPGKIVIAHVGNLGEAHYTYSFFNYIRANQQPQFQFLFIGPADQTAQAALEKLAAEDSRVQMIGSVPHVDLLQYYATIDIGVILYKGIDFNHENCAPNKLYEYWSQGIPVLAHTLQGLTGVWTHPFMGKLVDMNDLESIRKGIDDMIVDLPAMHSALRRWFEQEGKLDIYLQELHTKIMAA